MIKKIIIGFLLAFSCIALILKIATWRNPGPNQRPTNNDAWLSIIYQDKQQQHMMLSSMNHNFDIHYVSNAQPTCFNAYFPAIHIVAQGTYNRWLHLIRTTDCKIDQCYTSFIDTWPEGHPFYTWTQDFNDTPFITYGLFYKPWSTWKGNVYAVNVNDNEKTIECIGGISWGYKLPWWSLRPIMILPAALSEKDWQTDWKIFQTELPGYENKRIS